MRLKKKKKNLLPVLHQHVTEMQLLFPRGGLLEKKRKVVQPPPGMESFLSFFFGGGGFLGSDQTGLYSPFSDCNCMRCRRDSPGVSFSWALHNEFFFFFDQGEWSCWIVILLLCIWKLSNPEVENSWDAGRERERELSGQAKWPSLFDSA